MKVLYGLKGLKRPVKKSAVTIGVFDGVHVGHQELIRSTIRCAQALGGKSVVITFLTHPEKHLNKDTDLKLLKNTSAKISRIKSHGIDMLILLDFRKIWGLTAGEFVGDILVKKLNMGCITVGRDFVFGKGGAGNTALLGRLGKKYGFAANITPDVKLGNRRVSSTYIRECLKKGDIKKVEKMLGREYSIKGKVLKGQHVGFDFPTANLALDYGEIPARGVWAVRVEHKGKNYIGAANIGFAPTLKNEKKQLLEVYIFDFSGDIYGDEIRVVFLERLRDEVKFPSKEALVKKVKQDIRYIRAKYAKTIK
jgi:riboflavin kinase/FMN adenylyltransferase